MPACVACHRAKVKCDQQAPCSRCVRLKIPCESRVSRQGQGQGPRKRRRREGLVDHHVVEDATRQVSSGNDTSASSKLDGLAQSEDGHVINQVTTLGKHHFGVLYLIHSWISFAFARRSFSLLSRASRLAAKCGVSMDEIFCQRRREILEPIMLHSGAEQERQRQPRNETAGNDDPETALQWSDLPPTLLKEAKVADDSTGREGRYIMIREAKNGHSNYLLSQAFQRDIASLWLIEQTWKTNEKPVVEVFLEGQNDFDKFTKIIGYQMSRYSQPNRVPECVRVKGVGVKMMAGGVEAMDMAYTIEILTLEHSIYVMELVPDGSKAEGLLGGAKDLGQREMQVHAPLPAEEGDPLANATENESLPLPVDNSISMFDDIEDLEIDADMQAILDLIGDKS